MSNDLEEFLRKAAERRRARQQSGNAPAPSQGSAPSQPSTPIASTPSFSDSKVVPTILEPIAPEPRQGLGPRLQSNIHPESILAEDIDQADDRVRARVHQQFDHSGSSLDKDRTTKSNNPSLPKKKDSKKKTQNLLQDKPLAVSSYEESRNDMTIERSASKMIATGSMMELLRDPQTLRTAFIASQIFERKF